MSNSHTVLTQYLVTCPQLRWMWGRMQTNFLSFFFEGFGEAILHYFGYIDRLKK